MNAAGHAPPAAGRGVDPLDADATGALSRLASDLQHLESAIGHRFPSGAVVAAFNRALSAASGDGRAAWVDFYLALIRFVSVASVSVPLPAAADVSAAFERMGQIIADDFGRSLLADVERRRVVRRIRAITASVAGPAIAAD